MLVKFLIALCISIAFMSFGYRGTDSIYKAINDKDLETRGAILDTALVKYYCYHHGTLPNRLLPDRDADILKVMGLSDFDFTNITYHKLGERTFHIEVKLSTGTIITANSNKELLTIPEIN